MESTSYQLDGISVDRDRLEHGQQANFWVDARDRIVGDRQNLAIIWTRRQRRAAAFQSVELHNTFDTVW